MSTTPSLACAVPAVPAASATAAATPAVPHCEAVYDIPTSCLTMTGHRPGRPWPASGLTAATPPERPAGRR